MQYTLYVYALGLGLAQYYDENHRRKSSLLIYSNPHPPQDKNRNSAYENNSVFV